MRDEKVQAIRTRLEYLNATGIGTAPRTDAEALLAEVEHLKAEIAATTEVAAEHMRRAWEWALKARRYQAENTAMREVVQAVANMSPVSNDARALSGIPGWLKHTDLITQARTALEQSSEEAKVPDAGRSTPSDIKDCDHYWDAEGKLWCYSEPSDTWKVREKPTPAAFVLHTSARSYQRLVADFGPLRPLESESSKRST